MTHSGICDCGSDAVICTCGLCVSHCKCNTIERDLLMRQRLSHEDLVAWLDRTGIKGKCRICRTTDQLTTDGSRYCNHHREELHLKEPKP